VYKGVAVKAMLTELLHYPTYRGESAVSRKILLLPKS